MIFKLSRVCLLEKDSIFGVMTDPNQPQVMMAEEDRDLAASFDSSVMEIEASLVRMRNTIIRGASSQAPVIMNLEGSYLVLLNVTFE